MTNPKLIVFGIDALSYHFLREHGPQMTAWNWLWETEEDIQVEKLTSIGERDEPHTGPQWSSIYTGVTPNEHGITSGGWRRDGLDYANIETETVFETIDRHEYTQGIYNMPMTYPAPFVKNGWSIAGFPAPAEVSDITYFGADISHLIGSKAMRERDLMNLQMAPEGGLREWGPNLREDEKVVWGERITQMLSLTQADFLELAYETSPEVLWYGTHAIDDFCHAFGLDADEAPIQVVYTMVGSIIRDIIDELEPDNWLIVSDHGFATGEQHHDREGVCIGSFEDGDISEFVGEQALHTPDVASIVSDVLDLGYDWMGSERRQTYEEGDKKAIKERLSELGYV